MRASRQLTAIVYAACGIVWGTTWFAIRRCIGEGGYPPFTSAAIRFVVASMVLGGAIALGFGRPGPRGAKQVGAIVGCGLLSATSYGLIYLAEQSISGGVACTLYGTFPLFTALFATLGGIERVPRQALVGAFLFLATAVIPLGVLGATFDHKPVPWPPPLGPTAALLYLAVVGSAFVFGAYFYLLKHVTLMTASTLVLVEPIVALSVDAIGERDVVLGARAYAGITVTLVGIAISVLQRQAPPPAVAAPPA